MTDDEQQAVIEALRRIAGGGVEDGRDEVPGPVRVEMGAMAGRRLELDVVAREEHEGQRRFVLARGPARLALTLTVTGTFLFTFGDATLEVPDRAAGAAFADELAALFASPLEPAPAIAATAAPIPLPASWVRIGRRRDADGVVWEVLKLFAGDGDGHAELFLRLGDSRAIVSEKWTQYRAAWIALVEASLGRGRTIARRQRIAIGGGATASVPPGWIVRDAGGHWVATDPADRAAVELSWLGAGAEPGLPGARDRVRLVLEAEGEADAAIVALDRGDAELAWTERRRESDDTCGGPRRLAHHRLLIALGERGQVLVTAAYWPEDAAWLLPEWDRIVSTLSVP